MRRRRILLALVAIFFVDFILSLCPQVNISVVPQHELQYVNISFAEKSSFPDHKKGDEVGISLLEDSITTNNNKGE